jgi:CHAT domain-containing protein
MRSILKGWLLVVLALSAGPACDRASARPDGLASRPALPRLAEPPRVADGQADALFAHPYYWAAFDLYGDPE